MDRIARKKRFAEVMVKAPRLKAGLSRNKLALELYVSPKTVQNWEEAVSAPDAEQLIELHRICGTQIRRYLTMHQYNLPVNSTNEAELKERLTARINELTVPEMQALLFLLEGEHGSSTYCYLQKCVADLQSPLKDRQISGTITINSYQNALAMGMLSDPNAIQPDIDALAEATAYATQAMQKGHTGYAKSLRS